MTDPKRWSEGGDASELERELLRAGQSARLPESERRALWAGIALSLPVAPPPPTTPSLAATAGASAFLTKGAIFLAAVAGLSLGVARLWPAKASVAGRSAPAATPVGPVRANPAPAAVAPTPTPAVSVAAPSESSVAGPSESRARSAATSQLREESVAVLEARAALRSGDAARSLALLEQARLRFPRGALGQEREALTIQALARSGERASARRRAQSFLRTHPQSPYAADVRLVAGQ